MRRTLLVGAWLAALAVIAAWSFATLRVSGDLRLFLPAAQTADQRLMLQQIGEGPAARLLLIALAGDDAEQLVERSSALRARLAERDELLLVSNGEVDLDQLPALLQDYRYLLSDGPMAGSLDAPALREALVQRQQDLASPAAALIAPLIGRDPTLELLRVVEQWTPQRSNSKGEADRDAGVWLSIDQRHALLLVQTRAAGFDPAGQAAALAAIRTSDHEVRVELGMEDAPPAEISGPGAFAERMAAQTRGDASRYAGIASVALLLLMAAAYRSVTLPLLAGLPLASGALAGLAACVAFGDGEVHGITLAFGFTLLGVAQDYPVHLLSHRRVGESAATTARSIWPTLATGAGSSCLAYLIFLFAGVDALRQLAVFTVVGLATAALATRYLLPLILTPILQAPGRDQAAARLPKMIQNRIMHRAWPRWPAALLALLCIALLATGRAPLWNDDLAALTPVPAELLVRDRALRAELGAADVRWLLVLRAADVEQALIASERLRPALDALIQSGAISSVDYAARYLPSTQTQAVRQAALPDAATLATSLQDALVGLAFKPDAFARLLDDVEQSRTLPPLSPAALANTPLDLRVNTLLQTDQAADDGARAVALFTLSGVFDPTTLAAWAQAQDGLSLLDLKSTAQTLAVQWRQQVLMAMVAAVVLLLLTLALALQSLRRALRVLLPVALGTLMVLAILQSFAVSLTLFHLVSLVLAAGLGVDYALFFERAGVDPAEQRRTLHALLVCAASTLLVFALLALSPIPVLRAIGSTVALGVLAHILLAGWLTAAPTRA